LEDRKTDRLLAKQATADKNVSRHSIEIQIRAGVRRIKAHSDYTGEQGAHLGIEGPEHSSDLSTSSPDLNGIDQTGGLVALSFTKYKSDDINIYCQRENNADWVLLARATVSPFLDNRPPASNRQTRIAPLDRRLYVERQGNRPVQR
jgi:hypothetical protein